MCSCWKLAIAAHAQMQGFKNAKVLVYYCLDLFKFYFVLENAVCFPESEIMVLASFKAGWIV